MSFDDQSPYQSPQSYSPMPMEKPAGTGAKKPTGLVAVSVIALIFGILGMIGGCCGVIAPLFQDAIADWMDNAVAQSGPDAETQQKIMRAGFEASASMMIPTIATQLFGLLVSTAMVIGGIAGLRGAPVSRMLLAGAFLLCIPSRISDTIVSSIVSMRTNAAQMEAYKEAGMNQEIEMMGSFQAIGVFVGVGFSLLIVIMYVVLGIYTLRSKEIKAYTDAQANASAH